MKQKPIVVNWEVEKAVCEICSKMVKKYNIKQHMKNHQKPDLECRKCDRKFRWDTSLRAHMNSAHSEQTKFVLTACEFCGQKFKDKTNLKNHRFSHTGGGNYNCAKCGKYFIRNDQYKNHLSKCKGQESKNLVATVKSEENGGETESNLGLVFLK